jgi:hypothetical protein
MVVKYYKREEYITAFSIPRSSRIHPNWYFWSEKKPSGNPVWLQQRKTIAPEGTLKILTSSFLLNFKRFSLNEDAAASSVAEGMLDFKIFLKFGFQDHFNFLNANAIVIFSAQKCFIFQFRP